MNVFFNAAMYYESRENFKLKEMIRGAINTHGHRTKQ